jgi:tetratricopeptide (TPR) repeat protein
LKKILIYLLVLVIKTSFGQIPEKTNGKSSSIDVKGNNNIIKVVQGEKVVVYNLNNEKDSQMFLSYLKSLPQIKSELREILSLSNQTLTSINKMITMSQDLGIFSVDKFLDKYAEKVEENTKLKLEIENLKKQTNDKELTQILEEATKSLNQFDNEMYQTILNKYKNKKKEQNYKERKEIAGLAYLQAKNNHQNYKWDDALEQIEEALEYDSENVEYLQESGLIYMGKDIFNKSFEAFEKVLVLNKDTSINDVRPSTYTYMGMLYMKESNYEKAISYFHKSLNILINLFGRDNKVTASSYNNIGIIYFNMKDYDNAIYYLKRAIEVVGEKDIYTPSAYNNLALVYEAKNYLDSSLTCNIKAVEISEKYWGNNNSETGSALNVLGRSYLDRNEYKKSLECLSKALMIKENIYGKIHPDIATIYLNLGQLYKKMGVFDTAINYTQKAINIEGSIFGSHHVLTSEYYNSLAVIYYEKNDYNNAIEVFTKVIGIQESVFGKGSLNISQYYFDFGVALLAKGEKSNGLYYINQSLFKNESDITKAEILNGFGVAAFERKSLFSAINLYSSGLEFLGKSEKFTSNNLPVILYQNLALAQCFNGNKTIAFSLFEKAIVLGKQKSMDVEIVIKNYEDCKNK